jgi:hypothetical protein
MADVLSLTDYSNPGNLAALAAAHAPDCSGSREAPTRTPARCFPAVVGADLRVDQ